MKRRLKIVGGVALLAIVAFAAVALTARSIPDVSRHAIDLEAWRTLAGPKDARPTEVRVGQISTNAVSRLLAIAGDPRHEFDMRGYAFQVRWADGTTLFIDPINDAVSQREVFPDSGFDQDAWDAMQQAMHQSKWIVFTHEHFDHVNGLINSPAYDALVDKAVFTRAQLESPIALSGVDDRTRQRVKPLDYAGAHAFAPGVVLIEAPSHTPGSQLIYVRMQDDTEVLFVGDVAWNMENITTPATRPRFVEWAMSELGDETAHWLRAFYDLYRQHPEVLQVVAHDPGTVRAGLDRGVLTEGLVTGP